MTFQCPKCQQTASLEIQLVLQLPPDHRSDDIVLQVLECSHCEFQSLAVYEESRRGSLETESWEHTGYIVKEEAVKIISEAIRACPNPFNKRCDCDTHLRFTNRERRRAWLGIHAIEGLEIQETFRMYLK
jgi:ferredoxin